jgi:hypothetical protein
LNALNTARVRLDMAAEYLHEDLNFFNDQVIAARHGDYHNSIVEE